MSTNDQIAMAECLVEVLGDDLDLHPLWFDEFQETVCIAQQLWAQQNGYA